MDTTEEECHALTLQLQIKYKQIKIYECFPVQHLNTLKKMKL